MPLSPSYFKPKHQVQVLEQSYLETNFSSRRIHVGVLYKTDTDADPKNADPIPKFTVLTKTLCFISDSKYDNGFLKLQTRPHPNRKSLVQNLRLSYFCTKLSNLAILNIFILISADFKYDNRF